MLVLGSRFRSALEKVRGNWWHVLTSFRMTVILVRPMINVFPEVRDGLNLENSMVLRPLIEGNQPFPAWGAERPIKVVGGIGAKTLKIVLTKKDQRLPFVTAL